MMFEQFENFGIRVRKAAEKILEKPPTSVFFDDKARTAYFIYEGTDTYSIILSEDTVSCTCPSFGMNGRCKHILYAFYWLEQSRFPKEALKKIEEVIKKL